MDELIAKHEWGAIDRRAISEFDPETIWRATMIQAFLVGELPKRVAWHRLEAYHDCLYLAGPKLWARLVSAMSELRDVWEGDIGDLFRSYWSDNPRCCDCWESDFLLNNPFLVPALEDRLFREIVGNCWVKERLPVGEIIVQYLGGES